jgi:hypothetical protein
MSVGQDRWYDEINGLLKEDGAVEVNSGSGHIVYRLSNNLRFQLPTSPSIQASGKQSLSKLKRLLADKRDIEPVLHTEDRDLPLQGIDQPVQSVRQRNRVTRQLACFMHESC